MELDLTWLAKHLLDMHLKPISACKLWYKNCTCHRVWLWMILSSAMLLSVGSQPLTACRTLSYMKWCAKMSVLVLKTSPHIRSHLGGVWEWVQGCIQFERLTTIAGSLAVFYDAISTPQIFTALHTSLTVMGHYELSCFVRCTKVLYQWMPNHPIQFLGVICCQLVINCFNISVKIASAARRSAAQYLRS